MRPEERIPKKANFLNPCLTLEEEDVEDQEARKDQIKYTLKVRANASGANVEKYQIYVSCNYLSQNKMVLGQVQLQ